MRIRRGKTIAEKHQEKQNRQEPVQKPLTAAQKRKVEQLRQRVAEMNDKALKKIPGTEIR